MAIRSAAQLARKPGEWVDHQREERRRTLAALLADLERARNHRAPWYLWIVAREAGEHQHDLRDEQSNAIACPVAGCDHGRGTATAHRPAGGRRGRLAPL